MDASSVAQRVESEISAFFAEIDKPIRLHSKPLVGVPWSAERYRREIAELRKHLQTPTPTEVVNADSLASRAPISVWVVTRPDSNGYVVLFDPQRDAFGLAVSGDGPIETVAVWGDLVTTFAAR